MNDEIRLYDRLILPFEAAGAISPLTFPGELRRWAREYGDRTAVIQGDEALTYKELEDGVNRLAAGLGKLGIGIYDRVIVQLPNSIPFVLALFALFRLGARPVLALPAHRERELAAVCELAAPKAYITLERYLGFDYERLAGTMAERFPSIQYVISNRETGGAVDLKRLLDHSPMEEEREAPGHKETALYLLSGGTTGTPKLIPKTHAAYLCNARLSAKRCGLTGDSVYMAVLSVSHDYPLCSPGILGTFVAGGTAVLCSTPDPLEAFSNIERHGVTCTSIVPAIANVWLEFLEAEEDGGLSTLSTILVGAAPLEPRVGRSLAEKLSCTIIQGYGQSEGITCFTSPADSLEIALGCQGKPVSPHDEIKIVDEEGGEVPQGQFGQLLHKGPYMFTGYYRAPELNRQSFTADGFFCTGDGARITAEGNVEIRGRVVEQINRAGENVIPSEIEACVKRIAGVKDAAVLGIPDEELGERICACIIAEGEAAHIPYIYQSLGEQKLASFKLPDQIVFVESFPYSNIGKVDKRKLRKRILQTF